MIIVKTEEFKNKLRHYAAATGKSIQRCVHEEAKLTAERIMKAYPPKTQAQGRARVKSDIERVYLTNDWFDTKFTFTNTGLGDRVKGYIQQNDTEKLEKVFGDSPNLARIHIEEFDASRHRRLRKDGKIGKGIAPYSYPVSGQKELKEYITRKQKNVGMVKAGWGACVVALGGTVAGWLSKGTGGHIEQVHDGVVLRNTVPFASDIENKKGFARYAIVGRVKDLAKKVEYAIKGNRW
jgi:hypothetical protein